MPLGKRRRMAPVKGLRILAVLAGLLVFRAADAPAAAKWLSVKPDGSPGRVCIALGDEEYAYDRLDSRSPLQFSATGPRRVKIITRYLYGPDDPGGAGYTVSVIRDGVLLVRKALTARVNDNASICGRAESRVGVIRRLYLDVPKGAHTYRVLMVEDDRRVAARVFQQVEVRQSSMVSLTPAVYTSLCTLQFSSGSLSEYYGFDGDHPLSFRVVGPTRIKVCTRMDFDHTMNGSQSYGIEVLEDGNKIKVYQYDVRKMATVCYLERRDILPGERKCFHIRVPKGPHAYEIRIGNGTRRQGAAKVYIPKSDLKQ